MMLLGKMLQPDLVMDLDAPDKVSALAQMCDRMAEDARILDRDAFHAAIVRRESQFSTGIGMGVALPHVKIPQVADLIVALGRLRRGIEFDALDGQPVHLILMIAASDRQTRQFVQILAQLVTILKDRAMRQALLKAPTPEALIRLVREHEAGNMKIK